MAQIEALWLPCDAYLDGHKLALQMLLSSTVNVSGRETSARPNPEDGHRLMRAFLSIEQAALRERIVNFVMELTAIHGKPL